MSYLNKCLLSYFYCIGTIIPVQPVPRRFPYTNYENIDKEIPQMSPNKVPFSLFSRSTRENLEHTREDLGLLGRNTPSPITSQATTPPPLRSPSSSPPTYPQELRTSTLTPTLSNSSSFCLSALRSQCGLSGKHLEYIYMYQVKKN